MIKIQCIPRQFRALQINLFKLGFEWNGGEQAPLPFSYFQTRWTYNKKIIILKLNLKTKKFLFGIDPYNAKHPIFIYKNKKELITYLTAESLS